MRYIIGEISLAFFAVVLIDVLKPFKRDKEKSRTVLLLKINSFMIQATSRPKRRLNTPTTRAATPPDR